MANLLTGARLGPYEILAPLRAGGMGEVYRARDNRLDRTVAIKVLPPAFAADPPFRERFDREAKTISQLDHPNICAVYDVGRLCVSDASACQGDEIDFIVTQYLEGETLDARLKSRAPSGRPIHQTLAIAIDVASALDMAHGAGIVHRDLNRGNVMLTKTGAKLLDFGLAKTGVPVVSSSAAPLSPNARRLPYQLGVGAGPRIFVKPYGAGEGKYQVSSDSAVNARWRADGRELFFLEAGLPRAPRGDLVAVDVGANAASLDRGASHPLFVSEAISFQHPTGGPYQPCEVSRDGQRFLPSRPVGAMTTADDQANAPIAVMLNWAAALK